MNKVTDPEILAKLNGSSGGSRVTDPELLAKLNGTSTDVPMVQQGVIPAVVSGAAKGYAENATEIAEFANEFIKSKSLGKLVDKGKEFSKFSDEDLDPKAYGKSDVAGRALGYTGGLMTLPGAIVKTGIRAAKAIPAIARSLESVPGWLKGASRLGAEGMIAGAASSPDDRLFGSTLGGLAGSLAGGVGGALGSKMTSGAKNIEDMIPAVSKTGTNTNSSAAYNAYRTNMEGLQTTQREVAENAANTVQSKIDPISPDSITTPPKSPNRLLTARAAKNFTKVEAEKKALYRPLEQSTETIDVALPKTSAPKKVNSYLPDEEVSTPIVKGQATFSELQAYRQELDLGIKSAKQGATPLIVKQLIKVRNEITTKMEAVAGKSGLQNEFKAADKFYHEDYLPFKTLSKTGKVNDPTSVGNAYAKINTIMGSKNPNPNQLKDLVKTVGEEGEELVAWASIENAVRAAKNADGTMNLSSLSKEIGRWNNSGVGFKVYKQHHLQAIQGIKEVAKAAEQASKQTAQAGSLPIVSQFDDWLFSSESTMKLMRVIGSSKAPAKMAREFIQQFVAKGIGLAPIVLPHKLNPNKDSEALSNPANALVPNQVGISNAN